MQIVRVEIGGQGYGVKLLYTHQKPLWHIPPTSSMNTDALGHVFTLNEVNILDI